MKLIAVLAVAALAFFTLSSARSAPPEKAKCPVSGKEVEVSDKTPKRYVQGIALYFCCDNCPKTFAKNPEKYLSDVGNCPVLGTAVNSINSNERVIVNNGLWYTCCPGCVDTLKSGPAAFKELEDVVSGKKFNVTGESPAAEFQGQRYYFQNAATKAAFEKEPSKYAVIYGK